MQSMSTKRVKSNNQNNGNKYLNGYDQCTQIINIYIEYTKDNEKIETIEDNHQGDINWFGDFIQSCIYINEDTFHIFG